MTSTFAFFTYRADLKRNLMIRQYSFTRVSQFYQHAAKRFLVYRTVRVISLIVTNILMTKLNNNLYISYHAENFRLSISWSRKTACEFSLFTFLYQNSKYKLKWTMYCNKNPACSVFIDTANCSRRGEAWSKRDLVKKITNEITRKLIRLVSCGFCTTWKHTFKAEKARKTHGLSLL